jgi:phosphoribosylglycinamide formyltransferase-1
VSSNDNLSSESKERDRKESLPHESQKPPLRLGVLISGSGSNLQALIDAIEREQLPGIEIALVVSNKADAYGLQRALKHKIPAIYVPWSNVGAGFTPAQSTPAQSTPAQSMPTSTIPSPATHTSAAPLPALSPAESQLSALLHLFQVDLVVLAGWMRILSASFLEQFPQRVINIHPALLPDNGIGNTYTTSNGTHIPVFRGLHAVQQALDAGVKITGSCVHFVTPQVDAGPVICREELAIEVGDTEESLHERLKAVEHRLIVEAVRMYKPLKP